MDCLKCSGLLIIDSMGDVFEGKYIEVIKCVNCGVVYDEVILKNKNNKPKAKKIGRSNKYE